MKHRTLYIAALSAMTLALAALVTACTVKYSLSGASISPDAKTVSIAYFPNNAPMIAPTLSALLTDGLKDKFARQTKLMQVSDGAGDLSFQGEIIGYAQAPATVSATTEMSTSMRLTVTVRVTFVNLIDTQWSFSNKTFSAYQDYTTDLSSAEATILPDIVDELVDKIFNEAVANW